MRFSWRWARFASSRLITSNRCWSSSRRTTSAAPAFKPSTMAWLVSSSVSSTAGTSLFRRRICWMAAAGVRFWVWSCAIRISHACSSSSLFRDSSLVTCCARLGRPALCSMLIKRSASAWESFRMSRRIVSLRFIEVYCARYSTVFIECQACCDCKDEFPPFARRFEPVVGYRLQTDTYRRCNYITRIFTDLNTCTLIATGLSYHPLKNATRSTLLRLPPTRLLRVWTFNLYCPTGRQN